MRYTADGRMEENELNETTQDMLKKRMEEARQMQENEKKIRSVLMRILEPNAYERMMNVKLSNNNCI